MQSVQNEHENEAIDGQQEDKVEASVNDCEKTTIPNDLLPVAYGSKTLTDAEGRYANIERELVGVVASMEKFHIFCYGRSTIILSDHKPLTSIVRKEHHPGYGGYCLGSRSTTLKFYINQANL